MSNPKYSIVEADKDRILIRDEDTDGDIPTEHEWVEAISRKIAPQLNGRRLEYYDDDGFLCEILIENGQFAGYRMV